MKLRLRGNTLRLRLLQGEVTRLADGETISETAHFGNGTHLTYVIMPSDAGDAMRALYAQHCISIQVPPDTIAAWATSAQVAIESTQATADGPLQLLIEKDFACLVPTSNEDQSDAFPNPATPLLKR